MNNDEIINKLEELNLDINDFHSIETLTDSYIEYAKNINSNKIMFSDFGLLNEHIRGLRVQELLTIVAGTGVGKSALTLNLLLDFVKNQKELVILFSLEMSTFGIAERLFQIELDKFGFEIENYFVKADKEFIQSCYNLKNSLNNLVVITNRVEVHQIPEIIKIVESIKNRKCKLIGIDYLGLMENKHFPKDEYLRATDNMKKLYTYAKTSDVAIINLSQTSRADVKGSNVKELSLYSAKSSGEVENSSDFFFTLEVVENPKEDENNEQKYIDLKNTVAEKVLFDLMRLSVHKNRRGKKGKILLEFNRKNLRISEINLKDDNSVKPIIPNVNMFNQSKTEEEAF